MGSPAPIVQILGKFTTRLDSIRVIVEDLVEPPPDVPRFPPDVVLNSMFTVDLPDSGAEDLSVSHVTLFVKKDWIEDNNIHKWSIQFNRLDEEINAWVPYPSKRVSEDQERIYYSVGIPGFSVFALTGSASLPEQVFQVADLQISPQTPAAGESVSISASVTNASAESAIFPASLWINSTLEDVNAIPVEAGQTVRFSFDVEEPAGSYTVRIDREFGQFDASPAPQVVTPEATATPLPLTPTPTPSPVPTPTATPSPTATPTPTATPAAAVAVNIAAPTAVPPSPTPQTIQASPPTASGEDGNHNIVIALAVGVGLLGAIGIVGFAGYNIRRNGGP